jgi:hypothetical protein
MHIFNVNQGDDGGDTTMDKPQKALPVIGSTIMIQEAKGNYFYRLFLSWLLVELGLRLLEAPLAISDHVL